MSLSEDRKKRSARLFSKLEQLRKLRGPSFISAVWGDPCMHGFVNQKLVEAINSSTSKGLFMYPGPSGYGEKFKNAVAKFEKTTRNVSYDPATIIPTTGVSSALHLIHTSLIREGDQILAFAPNHYFYGSADQVVRSGGSVKSVPTYMQDGWVPDPGELRKAITDKSRFLLIVNPHNPVGVVYSERILKEICDICAEYELPIISDEIYGHITYDGIVSHSTAKISGENLVLTLSGMSKIFAATGLRVGYICVHGGTGKQQEIINDLKVASSIYGQTPSAIATPILAAATQMFEGGLEGTQQYLQELQRRRDFAVKELPKVEGITMSYPEGALYTFAKIGSPEFLDEFEFLESLAEEENLGLISGSTFGMGGEGCFRGLILFSTEVQAEAYSRLARFLKRWKSSHSL